MDTHVINNCDYLFGSVSHIHSSLFLCIADNWTIDFAWVPLLCRRIRVYWSRDFCKMRQ